MQISILVTAYRRPAQLREALASVAGQDLDLIGEILVGDDSPPADWPANLDAIAASGVAHLVHHLPAHPPRGTYPNQIFLGNQAKCSHVLLLHDDDQLCPGALARLSALCENEADSRVKVWFGRIQIMDEDGRVDLDRSRANDAHYGRAGPGEAKPMWDWALTESLPPNSFLMARETYTRFAPGERDGNVGDWGLVVRLANSGAWGRLEADYLSRYRVQSSSVTNAGRGVDVHRWYELLEQLDVQAVALPRKNRRLAQHAMIATTRYLRDGERMRAWRCFFSRYVSPRQRLSARGLATLALLLTPRVLWRWALVYKA